MRIICILFKLLLLQKVSCDYCCNETLNENFRFGIATSAYQIEGGWNADGKGKSIWDTFTHNHPELIADGSNGDIAADSYNNVDKDIEALRFLGVDFYRFSISWTRILPKGDRSIINQAGLNYYNDLINKLLHNGIEPMVTMYHFDLPHELQKLGGFTNPLFVTYFETYADILFTHYADRVKLWITFNEPYDYCLPGYAQGIHAPGIRLPGIADYLCMHHTLQAHAVVYRLYKRKYFEKYNGKVAICINTSFYYSQENDTSLVNRIMQFRSGWLLHPLLKNGNYPDIMIQQIQNNSRQEGRKISRLPELDENWQQIIKGATDFIALNYYTSKKVFTTDNCSHPSPSWECDVQTRIEYDKSRKRGKSSWLYNIPEGLNEVLRWIKDEYSNIEVVVTENGWSDDGSVNDTDRIDYIKEHLRAVMIARNEYNCNVTGYAVWSLLDNFEWSMGFTEKFGLFAINFTSSQRERMPKASANFYKSLINSKPYFNL